MDILCHVSSKGVVYEYSGVLVFLNACYVVRYQSLGVEMIQSVVRSALIFLDNPALGSQVEKRLETGQHGITTENVQAD
jgi:hypothetical protein